MVVNQFTGLFIIRENTQMNQQFLMDISERRKIRVICTCDENNAIGIENRMLYHIPECMQQTRDKVTGNWLMVGRRTYTNMLDKGREYLEGVHLIVVSSSNVLVPHITDSDSSIRVAPSYEDAVVLFDELAEDGCTLWIGGGASLYEQAVKSKRVMLSGFDFNIVHTRSSKWDVEFPDNREGSLNDMTGFKHIPGRHFISSCGLWVKQHSLERI